MDISWGIVAATSLEDDFFKINQNKPLSFSSAELAICDLPSLYESVTLDSLDKPQMADALMHLKKMTGNKHNKPLLE